MELLKMDPTALVFGAVTRNAAIANGKRLRITADLCAPVHMALTLSVGECHTGTNVANGPSDLFINSFALYVQECHLLGVCFRCSALAAC